MIVLGVAAVAAIIDWWAVAREQLTIERWAKPATMALLVAVAATYGEVTSDIRSWLVVGAIFGLIGDIALLNDGETAFMTGLGAFLIGHLAYVMAALETGWSARWAIGGAVVMIAIMGVAFVPRILPGSVHHGGPILAAAVVAYAAVIGAMVITVSATAIGIAALGAILFALSDSVLGYQRFVGPLWGGRLSVMIPYHLGQALLIVGLVTT
ncbi:MAG: hypothetical protein CSA55_04470 [Ilumatobacter coccineus]|uniref:Lysoplasmalogenase n=1 Tax=Ilumatobacter coccineus TaxID=467094 RepID=A0A2G6KAW4_9ACTN|nr:MAG: hypothetical protein CSA55_04470 [Ilumatobacter coccineus]